MNNPESLRQMLSPENMQAMVQMQQAMQQLQGTGLVPPGAGGGAGGGVGGELCWLTKSYSKSWPKGLSVILVASLLNKAGWNNRNITHKSLLENAFLVCSSSKSKVEY